MTLVTLGIGDAWAVTAVALAELPAVKVTPARPYSPAVGVIQTGDGRRPYSPMERRAMSLEPRRALSSVATGKTGGLYAEPWGAERLQPRTSLEKKPKESLKETSLPSPPRPAIAVPTPSGPCSPAIDATRRDGLVLMLFTEEFSPL